MQDTPGCMQVLRRMTLLYFEAAFGDFFQKGFQIWPRACAMFFISVLHASSETCVKTLRDLKKLNPQKPQNPEKPPEREKPDNEADLIPLDHGAEEVPSDRVRP